MDFPSFFKNFVAGRILHQFQGQDQGQGQDQKWRQRSALQQQMVLTLTLVLTLELVQDSASQPYLSWITMFWITIRVGLRPPGDPRFGPKGQNLKNLEKIRKHRKLCDGFGMVWG